MSKLDKHAKEHGCIFTCVTNVPECRQNIKETVIDFPSWAYIDHEPDDENGKEHTHFIFRMNGRRTVQQVADRLEISPQYVQVVHKIVGFYRYMVHKDNPEKKQYKIEDIVSNHLEDFREVIEGTQKTDVNSLFAQFQKLQSGDLTPADFIQQNYVEFNKMAFSQKIKTFEIICKNSGVRIT